MHDVGCISCISRSPMVLSHFGVFLRSPLISCIKADCAGSRPYALMLNVTKLLRAGTGYVWLCNFQKGFSEIPVNLSLHDTACNSAISIDKIPPSKNLLKNFCLGCTYNLPLSIKPPKFFSPPWGKGNQVHPSLATPIAVSLYKCCLLKDHSLSVGDMGEV